MPIDYNAVLSEFKAGTATAPPKAAANTIDYDGILNEFKAGQKSTLESVGERALGALPLGSDFSEGYNRAVDRGTTRMGDAVRDIGKSGVGPGNVGSAALGALEYVGAPFEGAGTFIGNPIRRAGAGIPGAETVAATADLAPLMFAPFPGAKMMQGAAAGVGSVMGEAPAALAALQNTIPWLAKFMGRTPEAPAPVAAEPPLRPSELPAGTPSMTSGVPARRDWLDQTARGGPAPLTPGQEFSAPSIKGVKQADGKTKGPEVQRAGKTDLDPNANFSTVDPSQSSRTSAMPTQPPGPEAPVEWFQQQTAGLGNTMEGPFGGDPSTPMNAARQVPVGPPNNLTHPSGLEYMRLPNVRANSEIDPQLEAAIMERMGFTRPQQAGVNPVRNLELDPQNPGLDPWYSDTPYPNATPMPGSMNAPSPFRNPGRDRNISAAPPPTGPEGWGGGGVPRAPGSGGWGGGGPNPRPEDRPPPNPSGGWGGGPTTPNPSGGTPPSSDVQERLRQFRGGSVPASEVPPLKQPETNAPTRPTLPPPVKPTAAAPSAFNPGDTVDIVHKVGGKEMRMPGGTVVEITSRKEPVFERKLRTESGEVPQRIKYEDKQYAKLEDGREVPVSLLQRQGPSLTEKPMAKEDLVKPVGNAKAAISDVAEGTVKTAEDLGAVIKGIRQALKFGDKSRVPHSYIKNYLPVGTSKSAFNRAVAEMQKTDKALVKMTDATSKDQYLTYRKLSPDEKAAGAEAAKTKQFDKGFSNIRKQFKGDTTYLHNFDTTAFGKYDAEIKTQTIAKRINHMIEQGEVTVKGEQTGKAFDKVNSRMFDPNANDEDFLITFKKKSDSTKPTAEEYEETIAKLDEQLAKNKKRQAEEEPAKEAARKLNVAKKAFHSKQFDDIQALKKEFDNGDITGTEFLDAMKRIKSRKEPK